MLLTVNGDVILTSKSVSRNVNQAQSIPVLNDVFSDIKYTTELVGFRVREA